MSEPDTYNPASSHSAEDATTFHSANSSLQTLKARIPRLLTATQVGAVRPERMARIARRLEAYVETHRHSATDHPWDHGDKPGGVAADTDALVAAVDTFLAAPDDRGARLLEVALNRVATAAAPLPPGSPGTRSAPDTRQSPEGPVRARAGQAHLRRPASQPDSVESATPERTRGSDQWVQRQERRIILALGMASIALGWLVLSSLSQPLQAPRSDPETAPDSRPPSAEQDPGAQPQPGADQTIGAPGSNSTTAQAPDSLSKRQTELESRLQRIEALLAPMDDVKTSSEEPDRRDAPGITQEQLGTAGAAAVAGAAAGALVRTPADSSPESPPTRAPRHQSNPASAPKAEVRTTPRTASQGASTRDTRAVPRPATKVTPRPEPKEPLKLSGRSQPQSDTKPSRKPDARTDPKPDAKPTPKPESKTTQPPKAKATLSAETRPASASPTKRPDTGATARPAVKPEAKPAPKPAPTPAPKRTPTADQDALF